jgi:hypothetical protein
MKDDTPQAMKKAVMIEWVDSQFGSGEWKKLEDISTNIPSINSIGFIVKETEKVVVIVQSIDSINKNYTQDFLIPKCSIIKITRLK